MTTTLSMGRVALTVNNLAKTGAWYESAVGLHLLSSDGETARYGAGTETLLELRQDKHARARSRAEAGLFHTAFLMPERADLGRWLLNASERRTGVDGASDHGVSEAVYLTDPEGNGVEIYIDRPRSQWKINGSHIEMVSDPLDIAGVVGSAHGGKRWTGAPDGTVIGHVHLQVGAVPAAEAFYSGIMGLDVTTHYPGAAFFGADGYHHHIAANTWNSRGASQRQLPSTGLTEMAILLSPERAAEMQAKLAADKAAPATNASAQRLELSDPWGTPIALTWG